MNRKFCKYLSLLASANAQKAFTQLELITIIAVAGVLPTMLSSLIIASNDDFRSGPFSNNSTELPAQVIDVR